MTDYFRKLKAIENGLNKLSKNKQINPKIADDLIQIGQYKVKLFLRDLLNDKYPNLIKPNKYSNFILYSYKSYYGDIPAQNSDVKKVYKRRLNLFHKGKRWSDETGRVFYNFLDKINDKFNDTPVNLFGELCSKNSIQHLIIKVVNKFESTLPDNTILLPDDNFLKKIKVDDTIITGIFKSYINYLNNNFHEHLKELTDIEDNLEQFKINALISEAKKNSDLMKFVNQISSFFGLSKTNDQPTIDRIIKAFFSYQFNDLPYELNLFFPINDEFLSTLMIAVNEGHSISKSDSDFFKDLTNNLLFLDKYEKGIVEETKKYNDSYIIWKKIYEREYNKLFSFMKSVENVCFSICKQNDIKFSHIGGRVKTFDSLYNKIFVRSNDKTENRNLKNAVGITYKNAIEEPHIYYHKIFQIIKDLAGVRVVLLFESDLDEMLKLFKKLTPKDLLLKDEKFYRQSIKDPDNNIDPADKKNIYNYRSLHLTVKPGKERLKLAEYNNLWDVQCEIQFRTVLAHAWADVNHDLDYKNREIYTEIIPDLQGILKKDFNKLSKKLFEDDKFLNKIKTKSKSIKIE
ncbi:MAG TPA: hypothetical protein VF571_20415 [Pyrinomonadaceae bacterium]|jgi:ppGpp synthetase/RelA/SpoT-type nucleotidyltranferase